MLPEIETLLDVLTHPAFVIGLVAGLVGGVVLILLGLVLGRPIYGWGLVFAVAVGWGLTVERNFEPSFFASLAVLAGAGLLVDLGVLLGPSRMAAFFIPAAWAAAALAVVWFIADREITGPAWIPIAFVLTVVAVGAGLWELGRIPAAPLVGPLMAVSIAGGWVTVPETDSFSVILGSAVPMALITLPPIRARASAAGALVLAAVLAWLVLAGGAPRPWTIASSWAAVATIPAIAAVVGLRCRRLPRPWLVVVAHVVYVVAITRVADQTNSVLVVLVWSVALLVLATIAVALLPSKPEVGQPLNQ